MDTRSKHNRQIHKANFLKDGKKKLNQAPYKVKGFRLFDKVKFESKECFIFGRRSTGYFDLRTVDGNFIHKSASYKKLEFLELKKSLLTERKRTIIMKMLIRQETNEDYDKVFNLIKLAFEMAEHSDGNEHDLANSLRKSDAFVPELSLVAEIDGKIAGHIMFTEGKVGNNTILVLAPLSVSPNFQKQGIGKALIAEAHKIAKEMEYQYSLVLGSERYYSHSGYLPAEQFGIEVPEGIPSANFMAIQLADNATPISGAVIYAKEFGM